MRGDLCQWDHGSDPVVLEDASAALSTVLALPPAPTVPGQYFIIEGRIVGGIFGRIVSRIVGYSSEHKL